MAQMVEVPGLGVVEFPDGMSDGDIAAAIKRNLRQPQQPERPALQQALGNIGAGAVRGAGSIGATLLWPWDKAQDIYHGARSPTLSGLVTGQQPVSRNEQRRADMDAALRSLGADPESMAFQGGKLGAEIAGTLPVGGILGRAAAPMLGQRVGQALTTSGFATGAAPSTLAGRAGDMALRMGAGGAVGGTSAAMVNPDDALTGAVVGSTLPPAVRALGGAGNMLGGAARNAAAMFSDDAARSVAAKNMLRSSGDDAAALAASLVPRGPIPLSAGALAQNDGLTALEQASRLRTPGPWRQFDQSQAADVWRGVQRGTSEADAIAAMRQLRGNNWATNWDRANAAFGGGAVTPSQLKAAAEWPNEVQKLRSLLDDKLMSPDAAQTPVLSMLKDVQNKIEMFGDKFSPAHLQQIRANLSGKSFAMSQDPLKAAPRDSPATIALLKRVDETLNRVTNGEWSKVVAGYAQDSAPVNAARAAGKVRAAFVEPDTGRLLKTAADAAGDIPRVTEAGLTSAMNRARVPGGTTDLSAAAQQELGGLLDALRQQAVVQQMKRSATAGGGSDTVANIVALGEGRLPGLLGGLLDVGRSVARGKVDRATAGLLTNPDELAALLAATRTAPLLSPELLGLASRGFPLLAGDR